ncbi:MAG: hypothetical protein ABII82_00065 [Verrucomicrobiota bacterium]
MQTTPHPLTALPVAGALLLLPALLQADLLTPDRMTPLASDYLQAPDTAKSDTTTAAEPDAPVTALPPIVVNVPPLNELQSADTQTALSRAELAERRYFTGATDTLNRFILPLFGRDRQTIALERLQEDERLADLRTLDTQIELIAANDSTAAAQLRELRHAAYIQSRPF